MTLMLILGAIAALYCLRLLFRSAKFAMPVGAAIALGFALRDLGFGWLTILGSSRAKAMSMTSSGTARRAAATDAPIPPGIAGRDTHFWGYGSPPHGIGGLGVVAKSRASHGGTHGGGSKGRRGQQRAARFPRLRAGISSPQSRISLRL